MKLQKKNTQLRLKLAALLEDWLYVSAKTYCCPPRSWIVQTTVVTVLQAAGIWHAGGVVDFKPVCMVGYSTATKLHQKKKRQKQWDNIGWHGTK